MAPDKHKHSAGRGKKARQKATLSQTVNLSDGLQKRRNCLMKSKKDMTPFVIKNTEAETS
jgi:hypothetical protein